MNGLIGQSERPRAFDGGLFNAWAFYLYGYTDIEGVTHASLAFHHGTSILGSGIGIASTEFSPTLGAWYNLAVTRSGSSYNLYVNGAVVATGSIETSIPDSGGPLTIGSVDGGHVLDGQIDEVTIFNRAMDLAEVLERYESFARAAVAVDDYYSTSKDNPLAVSARGVLINDASPISAVLVDPPSHGALTFSLNGGFTYTPNMDFVGQDSFTYRASDSPGSNVATAWIDVTQPVPATLPSGAVGWWKGDGNAKDYLGVHDGTLSGDVTFDAGKIAQSFDFHGDDDGNGDFVEVPDSPAWPVGSNDFSINAWVNLQSFHSTGGNHLNGIVGQSERPHAFDGGPFNAWTFYLQGHTDAQGDIQAVLSFQFGTSIIGSGIGVFSQRFSPTLGAWYNLAATKSGSTYTLYVNGVAMGSETLAIPISDSAAPLTIGSVDGGHVLNGQIDELLIYNRALTQAEVLAIYNAASAGLVIRVNAEDGAQSIDGVAQQIFSDVPVGGNSNLAFASTTDRATLFSVLPAIDSTGTLTFTPAPNSLGTATITVVKKTASTGPFEAEEGGDVDTETTTFTIEILQQYPLQNDVLSVNVDNDLDFDVVASDVLLIINYINSGSPYGVSPDTPPESPFVDANGDNFIAPDDVLEVINYINAGGPEEEGESTESAAPSSLAVTKVPSPLHATRLTDEALLLLLAADSALQSKRRQL